MLGEGTESEEGEDDPRSYKNKSVPQRMFIISAGVIMNMIFAVAAFVVVYMGPGTERMSGVVGVIDPGSPAWEAGLRSGGVLKRVGGIDDPYFDQIKPTIALSGRGESVPIVYTTGQGGGTRAVDLMPRYEGENAGQKLIGIAPAPTTTIIGAPKMDIPPVVPGSAADRAEPKVEHLDRIIAATDATGALTPLPMDPRNPASDRRDYFELHRRMVDRAGQPMKMQLQRAGQEKPVEVTVPPAFTRDLGLIMRIGPVLSVRQGSSAEAKGVQPRLEGGNAGDEIERVEVTEPGGKVIRYTNTRSPQPQSNVEERPLDPVRLPFELNRWADTAVAPKTVKLGVLRTAGHADRTKVELTLEWDDQWKYSRELPLSVRSPLSIAGLGLAYRVKTDVADVVRGSVAEKANVQRGDVVKSVKLYRDGTGKKTRDQTLRDDEWAFAFNVFNDQFFNEKLGLSLTRTGVSAPIEVALEPKEDPSWPLIERGFSFDGDTFLQKADSVGEAVVMGGRRVMDTAKNVYLSLRSMVTGGISFFKNANGPLAIAEAGYYVASESLVKFILLLAVLSVNLAVLNFLPIPVLDGGHMVFLTYEGLRGRPAPEVIRTAATFAGMALLLSLMACVLFLDFMKLIFKS